VREIPANVFAGNDNITSITFLGSGASPNSAFIRGDLRTKYLAGGAGVYTRTARGQVWTRTGEAPITVNTSLNGVWEITNGKQITVSGSNATVNRFGTNLSALTQNAREKGYVKVGDQDFRNIISTGNLTWSGQVLVISFNKSSPNVATGTEWRNCTITMNADGRTIDVRFTTEGDGAITETWTRR
jgi:hypothetical protein